jgi:hypothetical protein
MISSYQLLAHVCPHCNSDQFHDGHMRTMGMEVRSVYDDILYWFCPDCGSAWHRWSEGRLHTIAQGYIDSANTAVSCAESTHGGT